MQEDQARGFDWHERTPRGEARPTRIEEVREDDVRNVKERFWEAFAASRPRFGRLWALRDFATNLVRLFEMLTTPGFTLPWRTTAAIVFALGYFISSVDLIPDAIPILGFVDDALVVAEVMVLISADLARFEAERRARRDARVAA